MRIAEPALAYDGQALVPSHGPQAPQRIVLHTSEGHDEAGIVDLAALGAWFERQGLGYGYHVAVDAQGFSARYVRDDRVAWHTGGHNTGSLGIALIGFASFPRATWWRRGKQLRALARWFAYWSDAYQIPLERSLWHGVLTHAMASQVWPESAGHTDPGPGFPFRFELALGRSYRRWPLRQRPS